MLNLVIRFFRETKQLSIAVGAAVLFLLSGLAFWIVHSAIRRGHEERMHREVSAIQMQLQSKLSSMVLDLKHLRTFIYQNPRGNVLAGFKRYVHEIKLHDSLPGLRAVGYATLISRAEVFDRESEFKKYIPAFQASSYPPSDYHALVIFLDGKDRSSSHYLGVDLWQESIRRDTILKSIENNEAVLTPPITPLKPLSTHDRDLLLIAFLPVYKDKVGRSRDVPDASGTLYFPIRAQQFVEAALAPSRASLGDVGYAIDTVGPSHDWVSVLERLDDVSGAPAVVSEFSIWGWPLRVKIWPKTGFFSFFDRIIPWAASGAAAAVGSLILIFIRKDIFRRDQRLELIRLNRTVRRISQTLEPNRIFENFRVGVRETFGVGMQLGVFAMQDNAAGGFTFTMTHSTAPQLFRDHFHTADLCAIPRLRPGLHTVDCSYFIADSKQRNPGLCYELERAPGQVFGYVVFFRADREAVCDADIVLLSNLVKHLNISLQNSLLVRRVEDLSKSKSAFIANMSHEIRTPLNALLGFSEMLVQDDLASEKKLELLNAIRSNGRELMQTIDDILDLAKIEAGKVVVLTRMVSLPSVIDEVASIMRVRAQIKLLDLQFKEAGQLPEFIETDAIRLKQILMNLVGNAIKFTNVGRVIVTIKANRSLDTRQQFVDFFIEDSGIGIEDALKSELFQPFSQLDDSSTRRFGGTGLGLAISRRLARDLGGDLRLSKSSPGVGSIFHLRILAAESGVAAGASSSLKPGLAVNAPCTEGRPLRDLKILLVEDSADNQDIFSYYLTKAGAIVAIVGDGFEAVHKAHNQEFDLILMDVQLPGIDGKEATRRIRGHGFCGPIIALTAHARQDERDNCLEAGCGGHIAKPVSGEQLVDEVYRYTHSAPGRGINSPQFSS